MLVLRLIGVRDELKGTEKILGKKLALVKQRNDGKPESVKWGQFKISPLPMGGG